MDSRGDLVGVFGVRDSLALVTGVDKGCLEEGFRGSHWVVLAF